MLRMTVLSASLVSTAADAAEEAVAAGPSARPSGRTDLVKGIHGYVGTDFYHGGHGGHDRLHHI